MRKPNTAESIFANRVNQFGPDDCWSFRGCHNPQGYPTVSVKGKVRKVSHLALELIGQARPSPNALALHSCDNPRCVNPGHLRWGSHKDNSGDRRDRTGFDAATGEDSPRWIRSEQIIADALALRAGTSRDAANKLGVSKATIQRIWIDAGQPKERGRPPSLAQARAYAHLENIARGWTDISVSQMARDLGMAGPNLHRALHELLRKGQVQKRKNAHGRIEWRLSN